MKTIRWIAGCLVATACFMPVFGQLDDSRVKPEVIQFPSGLLMQIAGKVTIRGTDFFYVNDGSDLTDGSGAMSIRVSLRGLASGNTISIPNSGVHVRITGILGSEAIGSGRNVPVLRPRNARDVQVAPTLRSYTSPVFPANTAVQFSLPAEPFNPSPTNMFVNFQLDNRLGRWGRLRAQWYSYRTNNPNIFGKMLSTDGYALNSDATRQMVFSGFQNDPGADRYVRFPLSGIHLFGTSFEGNIPWARCFVTDGIETLTVAAAIQRGWIDPYLQWWDGSQYRQVGVLDGDDQFLRAWRAYWIRTHKHGLALILDCSG